jgi:hypothetical protein
MKHSWAGNLRVFGCSGTRQNIRIPRSSDYENEHRRGLSTSTKIQLIHLLEAFQTTAISEGVKEQDLWRDPLQNA